MAINRLGPVALAAAVLMLGGAVAAQASDDRQKTNRRTESAQPRQAAPRESAPPQTAAPRERAVPRESAPPRETASAPRPRDDSPQRTAEPRATSDARPVPSRAENTAEAAASEDQAVPRGSRPRDGRATSGRAVVRQTPIRPRQTIIYYPRRDYPFGYGGYGLGYFYYDPYAWGPYYSPGYYGGGYGYPYGYGGYGYGGYGYGRYAYGGIRLKVKPRDAEVYVDGYYAGRVDDFDGVFQRLELEAGPHRIEIREPGRPPLAFDVRIPPGETITYRGDLNKLR